MVWGSVKRLNTNSLMIIQMIASCQMQILHRRTPQMWSSPTVSPHQPRLMEWRLSTRRRSWRNLLIVRRSCSSAWRQRVLARHRHAWCCCCCWCLARGITSVSDIPFQWCSRPSDAVISSSPPGPSQIWSPKFPAHNQSSVVHNTNTTRRHHSQECKDPRRQCFCDSWPWPLTF